MLLDVLDPLLRCFDFDPSFGEAVSIRIPKVKK